MREKVVDSQDDAKELAEYSRNMEWLRACRKHFMQWYVRV